MSLFICKIINLDFFKQCETDIERVKNMNLAVIFRRMVRERIVSPRFFNLLLLNHKHDILNIEVMLIFRSCLRIRYRENVMYLNVSVFD
jgi:hypothetical protein